MCANCQVVNSTVSRGPSTTTAYYIVINSTGSAKTLLGIDAILLLASVDNATYARALSSSFEVTRVVRKAIPGEIRTCHFHFVSTSLQFFCHALFERMQALIPMYLLVRSRT